MKPDFYKHNSYKIPKNIYIGHQHICIYYNNMRIEWVLEDFSPSEIDKIAKKVQSTKSIKYNLITKNFFCKNKFGWNKIKKILMQNYYNKMNLDILPDNLIYQSLYNFSS